jgi:tetratricopeptide (TPR) repeat protein
MTGASSVFQRAGGGVELRRWPRRAALFRAAAVVAASLVGWALPATAQDEIVVQGNQAYQEGDWEGAIRAYESVLEAGYTSAGLEYNLGNAYFKAGDLGRSILHWERALVLSPGAADTRANLELARSLTADAVEPLPTFWLFAVIDWWIDLLPRALLVTLVGAAWLTLAAGVIVRIWARGEAAARAGTWVAVGGAAVALLLGSTLLVRELGIGRAERAIIMDEAVAVRSAPAEDDDLTLFEVHEGTRVRIDQRTGEWAEVVLDDGKVGWVPVAAMEII